MISYTVVPPVFRVNQVVIGFSQLQSVGAVLFLDKEDMLSRVNYGNGKC